MSGGTAMAVFTDGREHIFDEQRMGSWSDLAHQCDRLFIFDDSEDFAFTVRLINKFNHAWTVCNWHQRRGFGGSIQAAWAFLKDMEFDYVFHLEDDFVLQDTVDLRDLQSILDRNRNLAQIALMRQPWNERERAAGGIMEADPDDFWEVNDGVTTYVEHKKFFTTNPCLYRGDLLHVGWPDVPHSEGVFSHDLIARGYSFGFLGHMFDVPMVAHVGTERKGTGY